MPTTARYTAGLRRYEQSNHLGNVLAVLTDKASGQSPNANGQASYYLARVVQASGYYPFGWVMPGKKVENGYRYGFNGQERDTEWRGGHALAFKYRIHDARLGKFLSVDPLAGEYPWNSAYAFAENRVIDGIDLEGAEFVDVDSEENVNGPFTSQEGMKTIQANDVSYWVDLMKFEPSQEDIEKANRRSRAGATVQHIEDAFGTLNADYYSVKINELPRGVSSGGELLSYFRNNLDDFTDWNTQFGPYLSTEVEPWQNNENGTIMKFDVWVWYLQVDDLSVMQSKKSNNYFVFTTMSTRLDAGHPVSGNRQFGVTDNSDGTYTFFTRGIDRTHTFVDEGVEWFSGSVFSGADKLWQTVMDRMVQHVNEAGGEAERNVTHSKQLEWEEREE